ncbi:MAG: PAS domain S-box protein, partial [Acidobacteriota bacterium]
EADERLGVWTFWYALVSLLCVLSATLFVTALLRRQRQSHFEALALQEARYRALSEQTRDIFVLARPDGAIVEANAAAERAYGFTREELRRMNLRDLRAPSTRPELPRAVAAALRPEGIRHETVHVSRTGLEFPVEISAQPVRVGPETLLAGIVRDVSDRKAQEKRILKLNRLYRTLSEANQALVRARSRRDLLQETCRILVDHGGFLRACIVRPPEGGGPPSHEACHPAEAPVGLAMSFAPPDPLPAEPLVIRDGSGACAFLPLAVSGLFAGTLCVASADSGAFDEEEMGLLKELAGDLSFALDVQETRERKEAAEASLRENEERLRLALRAASQGLYDLNVQTGACVVSAEYATMLGYAPETFVETNQAWIERLHPEDREPVAEVYGRYVAGEIPEYRVEFRQRCADGTWKWILSLGKIVTRDGEGRPLRMLGTHTDLTERKRAEAQQRFYLEALNSSLDEIYVFDAETLRFEFASRGALDNLGYLMDRFRAMTPVDIKPAFTDETFREALRPLLKGDVRRLHFETLHRRADGTTYPVEVHLQLFDTGDRPVFVAFIQDITERMRAEEALRASEEKYRSILETMQESYYEVDLAGNLTFFNDSLCALFGYAREELLGMNNRQYT